MPDFRVSTEYYQVENGNEYRLGDTEEYYYEIGDEPARDTIVPSHGILSQGT